MTYRSRLGEGGPARPGPANAGQEVLLHRCFTESSVTSLRHAVSAAVSAAGLSVELAEDFVMALHELVTNAVRHGGGTGTLELRQQADVLTCEIVDHGGPADGLPVRLSPTDLPGGRGLWLAHQLTGSLMLTQRPDGVTASVSACVTASPAVPSPATTTDAVTGPSPSEDT
ncbi:ATP-binding protein [Amorphoplanes digitatis]|uniref:Anti-sigma regulatory factor (Ser/Thr protein kinase) n=1 Tax=Actinoplanes digitatis TaxID=1868 RepID=A0A7W7MPL0_9ACTN|nr:ATP-binding protein [Actinoplanes digitatis]MBB4761479.1 anti-sigma regulatory factor (Ser/Thr protein kinase) [Actinoplanes digitatis]